MAVRCDLGDPLGIATVTRTDLLTDFCREQHPRLVGLLSLYCGDRLLAEELAQDALVRVCERWEQLADLDDPVAWVTTVALNLARSQFRSRDAKRRALGRLSARERRHLDEADVATAVAVRSAIARLPERERRVLVLRFYADWSVREVADALRRPEGTVKRLTAQGIARLRAAGLEVTDE
jgi:RNA polymerase sigma factor (sigma-70 family)